MLISDVEDIIVVTRGWRGWGYVGQRMHSCSTTERIHLRDLLSSKGARVCDNILLLEKVGWVWYPITKRWQLCLCFLSVPVLKYSDKSNWKEREIVLAHSPRLAVHPAVNSRWKELMTAVHMTSIVRRWRAHTTCELLSSLPHFYLVQGLAHETMPITLTFLCQLTRSWNALLGMSRGPSPRWFYFLPIWPTLTITPCEVMY